MKNKKIDLLFDTYKSYYFYNNKQQQQATMSKSFNKGGQRRTIETGCGWRCVGHPNEVNKKFIIHKRYCKICEDVTMDTQFNRTAGDINGWKGQKHLSNHKNQSIINVSINGNNANVVMDNVKPTEAFEKVADKVLNDDELMALFTAPAPTEPKQIKSKKQKK